MLPLVCNDAVAILFMFDLSRKSTLNSVKEWYRQARGFNKVRLLIPRSHISATNPLHVDGDPVPNWDQVRHVRDVPTGRAGGDHEAGAAVRQGDARLPHLLQHVREHQRAEDLQDRAREGVRPQVRDPGNRGRRRTRPHLRRRLSHPDSACERIPRTTVPRLNGVRGTGWITSSGRSAFVGLDTMLTDSNADAVAELSLEQMDKVEYHRSLPTPSYPFAHPLSRPDPISTTLSLSSHLIACLLAYRYRIFRCHSCGFPPPVFEVHVLQMNVGSGRLSSHGCPTPLRGLDGLHRQPTLLLGLSQIRDVVLFLLPTFKLRRVWS
jgi:hypothetical protein